MAICLETFLMDSFLRRSRVKKGAGAAQTQRKKGALQAQMQSIIDNKRVC